MSGKTKIYKSASVGLIFLAFVVTILSYLLDSAGIFESILPLQINEHGRFNSFFQKLSVLLLIIALGLMIFGLFKESIYITRFRNFFTGLLNKFSTILNLKTLFAVNLIYILVLFVIAIMNYDLGTDEAYYLVVARTFWTTGLPYSTVNGQLFLVDYYSYCPQFILSLLLFLFNADSVCHFKILSTLISIVSLTLIFAIIKRVYDTNTSILFLFFLSIHSGFGFVCTSFFAEVPQTALIFLAVYVWLANNNVSKKTSMVTGILFALAIQTKAQSIIPIVLSLVVFHFVDKQKKPLAIVAYTLIFTFLLSGLRLIPMLFYNPGYFQEIPRIWYLYYQSMNNKELIEVIHRMVLFNKFLPLLLFVLIMATFVFRMKSTFEKFLYCYVLFVAFWWIFSYNVSNFRLIFMAVMTLMLFLSLLFTHLFREYTGSKNAATPFLKYMSFLALIMLSLGGFSTNIIYAYIGYNDGVQFDLDGSKTANFTHPIRDDSQKRFYYKVQLLVHESDSIYLLTGGIQTFVPQYYLGSHRVYNLSGLTWALDRNNAPKLVIIDRTAYPLGLSDGYKILDSLGVRRRLLLDEGEYELYEVMK